MPNLHDKALLSEALGRMVRLKVTTSAIRTVERHGGLDNYLLKTSDDRLSQGARRIKRRGKERARGVRRRIGSISSLRRIARSGARYRATRSLRSLGYAPFGAARSRALRALSLASGFVRFS